MTIRIHHPGDVHGPFELSGGAGRVTAHTNATVEGPVRDQVQQIPRVFALLWEGAPPGARMTQLLALRAFFVRRNSHRDPVVPNRPLTDVVVGHPPTTFPVSPPRPMGLVWTIDASRDPHRRDLGRVHVTDESYEFSERHGARIIFYDRPELGLNDARRAAAAQLGRDQLGQLDRAELIGRFQTRFASPRGSHGLVQWTCRWSEPLRSSISVVRSAPRYGSVRYYRSIPDESPTREELDSRIGAWRRQERRRSLERGRGH